MGVVDRSGPIADTWTRLEDDAPVVAGGSVIVSFSRLKNEHNALFAEAKAVGVEVPSDVNLDELEPFLPRLGVIVVRMANMRDGRAFSVGRLLRERYNYANDMRAVGDFIPDQVLFLLRCGFTTFEVGPNFPIDSLKRSVAAYTAWYQRASDRAATVLDLRHGANKPNGNAS
jgi:uncharacterized protein (DUF934 family)